jgi:adenine-specific DNA-methyltransferase
MTTKVSHTHRIWWGKNGTGKVPRLKNFFSEIQQGMMPMSFWKHTLAGNTQEAAKEMLALFGTDKFATPKPERLIRTVLQVATHPGDLVLDSFLGSGTTAAVAHKMGRRYIGIEMGEHAKTHCAVRLRKVIEGEQGGISKAVNWQGGGGFRFYQLGVPVFTPEGKINENVKFCNLAAHIWFSETKIAHKKQRRKSSFLGIHEGIAIALLYNGILGDKSVGGGNVLTSKTLKAITDAIGDKEYSKMVIYGEWSKIGSEKLKRLGIEFKQIPYMVK